MENLKPEITIFYYPEVYCPVIQNKKIHTLTWRHGYVEFFRSIKFWRSSKWLSWWLLLLDSTSLKRLISFNYMVTVCIHDQTIKVYSHLCFTEWSLVTAIYLCVISGCVQWADFLSIKSHHHHHHHHRWVLNWCYFNCITA